MPGIRFRTLAPKVLRVVEHRELRLPAGQLVEHREFDHPAGCLDTGAALPADRALSGLGRDIHLRVAVSLATSPLADPTGFLGRTPHPAVCRDIHLRVVDHLGCIREDQLVDRREFDHPAGCLDIHLRVVVEWGCPSLDALARP